jgi:hypothetical protein
MKLKLVRMFLVSAAFFLLITAAAKLISSFGHAPILETADPLLKLSYRHLFWLAGGIELIIAGVCILGRNVWLQAGLVAYLATNFVIYRIGINHLGFHLCPCMGYLTESLPVSQAATDFILKCILAYLLIGSYATLLARWMRAQQKASRVDVNESTILAQDEQIRTLK